MSEKFSLKDYLFNEEKVRYLAGLLATADKKFREEEFVEEVVSKFPQLELKNRIRWMAEVLERHLPREYEAAVAVILKSLPPPLDPTKSDDDFGDFIFAPFGEYVARNGCTKDRLKISLGALRELTMRFSMEDSVRYFLRAFPSETLAEMRTWASDGNYHIRRLVSEGTRPRLPWSGRVDILWVVRKELLTLLHSDPTRYVVRSIANHLNDEAKDNPDGVIEVLRAWQRLGKQDEKELTWLTKHALRTLIKNGHKETLEFLGYGAGEVTIREFVVTPKTIKAGEKITFSITVESSTELSVLIDYRIGFVKKNGVLAEKTFKWTEKKLSAKESLPLTKNHHLKANATTFTLYPGEHTVIIQVNGEVIATETFLLTI